jgi:hypothetical protein
VHAITNTKTKGSILAIRTMVGIGPPTTVFDLNMDSSRLMSLILKQISLTRTYGYIQTQSHVPRATNCAMLVDALAGWSHNTHPHGSVRRVDEEYTLR